VQRSITLLSLFILIPILSFGQKEKLIQFSGVVRNELLQPIQFAHIIIPNQKKGTISDQKGMFSFVVQPLDTILFSAVGYKKVGVIIPDTLEGYHMAVDVFMETDTIMIEEVIILPWKTYEEFKEAFLSLELPDDDLNRAYKNIALIRTQAYYSTTPYPELNYQYMLKDQYNRLYTQGQLPYYSIFNPLKWAEFFKYLEEGRFKKKKDQK